MKIFINKWKRGCLLFLALAVMVTSGVPVQAAVSGKRAEQERSVIASYRNMVAVARKNKLPKGKWIRNSRGIRYQKRTGGCLKNKWCSSGSKVYYFDRSGYLQTGSFSYNGRSYYADARGVVYVNKWRRTSAGMVYYGSEGLKYGSGWKTIRGKQYYFSRETKTAVKSSWVGNSYVDKNGVRVKNKTVNGRKIDKNGTVKTPAKTDKYIIVGASRIVDMSTEVNAKDTLFIAKGGQGYNWLVSTAGPKLEQYLKKNPRCKVIFNLGNNDSKNLKSYISYYKKLIAKYPKTKFYFLDCTPGDPERQEAKNVRRQQFNKAMKAAFGKQCIGGYDYLFQIGFTAYDGTHYPAEVSRKLYNYIIRKVKN